MLDQLELEYSKAPLSMATIVNPTKTEPFRYDPLPSVWQREDAELIERFLKFYPRRSPKRILDATINGGRFWRGSNRKIIGVDIEASHRPTVVANNTQMPVRVFHSWN